MTQRTNPDHLSAGDPIFTYTQMDNLPPGSVIAETRVGSNTWEKREDGRWYGCGPSNSGRGNFEPSAFSMDGYNTVVSITEGWTPPPPPPPDTLMQYMWKFRSNALSGAIEHGVSVDAARKGLRLLHIPDEWEMGPGIRVGHYDDTVIPAGTVGANVGHLDPDDSQYTLFVRKRNNWVGLLGRSGTAREIQLIEVPGVTETPAWWSEVGTEESDEEVREFKARAWRIGLTIKAEQSWCGTYESVVARVGVTRKSLEDIRYAGYGVGDRVSSAEAARMPNGTVFLFRGQDDDTRWAMYVRDDRQNNSTRTRRIAGDRGRNQTRALGNFATGMRVVGIPADVSDPNTVTWTVDQGDRAVEVIGLLAPGARFIYGGSQYVKCRDGQWTSSHRNDAATPATGVYASAVFNSYPVTINRFEEQS